MNDKQKQRREELALLQDAVLGNSGENRFSSTHNLPFEVGEWPPDPSFKRFRVGTVEGLWGVQKDCFVLLALVNEQPGNGHFEDVLEWFEYSCRREAMDLKVTELWNKRFEKHLVEKRGFTPVDGENSVIKDVRDM